MIKQINTIITGTRTDSAIIDNEWKAKNFPLSELVIAWDIFKEIKKCVKEDKFIEWEIELNSEQKVFLTKLIDAKNFTVNDAEIVQSLKVKLI